MRNRDMRKYESRFVGLRMCGRASDCEFFDGVIIKVMARLPLRTEGEDREITQLNKRTRSSKVVKSDWGPNNARLCRKRKLNFAWMRERFWRLVVILIRKEKGE